MRFTDAGLQAVADMWTAEPGVEERATADNLRFEERVSPARLSKVEAEIDGVATPEAMRAALKTYYEDHVCVDAKVPDTFLHALSPADLGSLDDEQWIVRYESLDWALREWGRSFADLQKAKLAGDTAVIEAFLADWNTRRDWRPIFAAFQDDLQNDLPPAEWAVLLRNRLGLAHYNCAKGSIPVGLFQYQVKEVKRWADHHPEACAFTAPTVLDQGPWPHFFPSPGEMDGGRAMALDEIDETRLLSEILHFRIPYRADHLIALEELSLRPPLNELKDLRNLHLLALRVASGRHDFGEDIP